MSESLFNRQSHPEIRTIIAVASGKGGVGKSTVAINLALALKRTGPNVQVGLLDADIYGPSQSMMLGGAVKAEVQDHQLIPVMRHGLQTISMGDLIDENTPAIWRGPMVSGALQQLYGQTRWQGLDYLVIDLPPGTGDVQLTLAQKIPVSGAVIVTTPQDIALLDVRKAVGMFQKVGVPVLGIIENMSSHICEACGHLSHPFGKGGASRLAVEYQLPVLGTLPLDISIREQTDAGNPPVVSDPEGKIAQLFIAIAQGVQTQLASQHKKSSGSKFPNIVVEKR